MLADIYIVIIATIPWTCKILQGTVILAPKGYRIQLQDCHKPFDIKDVALAVQKNPNVIVLLLERNTSAKHRMLPIRYPYR
jgi:hypothetical protein